ncbi:MAG: asparagine synthase (glutamine-hydrolyzing) [Steroidobacteraceae bacterium]|nr:asparagine synthase (glutamine-hydrolyzing) [Steroidobacteraceae bacterium]
MCGIAGFAGTGDGALLERMAASLGHRGPDDTGTWLSPDRRVGFAHRRLSILDLSPRGHQPMWDAGGRAVVCYNGEIYNFAELRDELEARNWSFDSTSDTEVLLKGYLEYGPGFVERLNGIFAFAIFDLQRRELFLARDHLGVKPLYLAEVPGAVLFASELKALLLDPRVPRDLAPTALLRYLTFLWSPGTATPLRAVRRVEPGTALVVTDGRIAREWTYYRPRFGGVAPSTLEECVAGVADRLRTAVHRQMVSDVPVGAFLSGGLDSSAVVAFARERAGERGLDCFTIAPDGAAMTSDGMAEDLPYAKRVAQHLGVRLHSIPVRADVVRHLGRVVYHLDEPQADPAAINVMLIAGLAREHGIKVLLSGGGGDDLFTGYRRHLAFEAEKYWSWLPSPVRRAAAALTGGLPVSVPLLRRIRKSMQYAGAAPDARLCGYFHWAAPSVAASLLVAAPDPTRADEPLLAALAAADPAARGLDRMLLLEQRFFLSDHNLLYTDKLSMAHGVEARVPFLDLDLVAYANSLPPAVKQRHGVGKWVLKRAMEPYLPRDVIYRPKTGFGAPLRQWVRRDLVTTIDEVLSPAALARRGVFEPRNARALIEADRAGAIDASYTVFAMLGIELWARTFLDPPQPTMLEELPGFS